MGRRGSVALGMVFLTAVAGAGGAQDPPPTTTLPPAPPTQQSTSVHGSVPDLSGRWLALATLRMSGERSRVSYALWDVGRRDGALDLRVRFVDLPPDLQAQVTKLSESNTEWVPTADELGRIDRAWSDLPVREAHVALMETTLSAPDGFDDALRSEPKTKDALWVATLSATFSAEAAPAVRQVQVYALTSAVDGGWTGAYVSTTIAAAPFPIPITFEGTAHLYRLGQRSGWQRFLDLFAGCGRR